MALSWYNGFSPEQREAVQRVLTRHWASGSPDWPPPAVCIACTQHEGAIHGHLENYDHPETYVPICITCHLLLHMRFRNREPWLGYVDHVAAGWIAPPLDQRSAFGVLRARGGILSGIYDGGRWRDDVPVDGSVRTYLDSLPMEKRNLASVT